MPIIGHLVLLVSLAGLLVAPSALIVRRSLFTSLQADAVWRLLLGFIAFLVSLYVAFNLGDAGALRSRMFEGVYAILDGLLGFAPGATPSGVFDLVRSVFNALDVGRTFGSLAWHAALLMPLVALSLYCAAVGTVHLWSRFFGPQSGLMEGAERIFGHSGASAERLRASARALLPATRWLALLLAAVNIVSPFLARITDTFAGTWYRDDLLSIVWVGGYVLMLEAWGVARRFAGEESRSAAASAHGATAPAAGEKLIDQLVATYDDALGDAVILKRSPPSVAAAPRTPPTLAQASEQLRPLLDWLRQTTVLADADLQMIGRAIRQFADQRTPILFNETLAELHYRIIGELLQVCQDEGGTALLICPDRTTPLVSQTLDHASRDLFPDLTRVSCVVGRDTPDENELYQLVIVPESTLRQDLFDWIGDLTLWHRRLRLIVCVEFARLDAALLRLRMEQLSPGSGGKGRRVVVQSDGLDDPESLVRDVFGLETLTTISLQPQQVARTVLRVVASDLGAAQRMMQHLFRVDESIDPLPLLMVPAWRDGFPVLHFDPEARRDQQAWDKLADRYLAKADAALRQVRQCVKGQDSSQHLRADPGVRVVLTEDHGNLVPATERTYAFKAVDAMLILVLTRPYPLRDFLRDKLAQEEYRPALEWLPMAAVPRLGLTEIAALVLPPLTRDRGLDQGELEQTFRKATAGLFTSAGIASNLQGLRKLFHLLTPHGSRPPRIETVSGRGPAEAFWLPEAEREHARRIFSFELPVVNHEKLRLSRGDYGLAYAQGTVVQLGSSGADHREDQSFFEVTAIASAHVRLTPRHYFDDHLPTRPEYVFARSYGPSPSDSVLRENDAEEVNVGPRVLRIDHLHLCFERQTLGYYTGMEDALPFSGKAEGPHYTPLHPPARAHRRFRSVLNLTLAGHEPPAVPPETVAFTCCVAVHDVLTTLFPRQAYRLAVLSPQAQPLYVRVSDQTTDALERFVLRSYGVLEQPLVPPVSAGIGAIGPLLDLYVIEDADYDLGIAGAVAGKPNAIFAHLVEYLGWLVGGQRKAPAYHALGLDKAPEFLAFAEALDLLAPLVGGRRRP